MSLKQGTNQKDANPLLTHIRNKGLTLWSLSRVLDMQYQTLKKWIKEPAKYLTYRHMIIIAGMTNTPVLYIIALINGTLQCNTPKWYEDQVIDMTFLTKIPSNDKPGT